MLVSCVTSLIIRVLLSPGVIFLPVCSVLPLVGTPNMMLRALAYSYPRVGRPLHGIFTSGGDVVPFLRTCHQRSSTTQCTRRVSLAAWLYKSIPAGLHEALFGIFMLFEYFSMVYVRADLTIRFFPRVIFLYFMLYHSYFFGTLYGFYYLARNAGVL